MVCHLFQLDVASGQVERVTRRVENTDEKAGFQGT